MKITVEVFSMGDSYEGVNGNELVYHVEECSFKEVDAC